MRNSGILSLGSVSLMKKGPFCHLHADYYTVMSLHRCWWSFLLSWNSSVKESAVYMHVHISYERALSVGPHLPSCPVHTPECSLWAPSADSLCLSLSVGAQGSQAFRMHQAFILICFRLLWGIRTLVFTLAYLHDKYFYLLRHLSQV